MRGWQLPEVGGPDDRSKFGEALDGFVGESWQSISQVVAYRDLHASAAFDDGQDTQIA